MFEMDSAQELLFGDFPRAVGVTTPDWEDMELRQYLVHSELEFDGVLDKISGSRNFYSSLSAYKPAKSDGSFEGCAVLADKVSFDFDSSAKAEPDADARWAHAVLAPYESDYDVLQRMKCEEKVRNAVLGDVCYNVRRLANESIERDIPIIGVFSGFGIHVHQLYQPTASRPGEKMGSTCRKFTAELNLSCADEKASGKPFRIMRVPNIERVCHSEDVAKRSGIYTVPLRADEMAEIDPHTLVDLSLSPRPTIGSAPQSRPEMKVQEDYLGPGGELQEVGQEKMRPVPDETPGDDLVRTIIKDIVQMPCVYERAFGSNPPNDVRVKLGIMLLNAGYSPAEATELIAGLNWVDFDRETTKYQLQSLRESGKGDWSCRTMQAKGLCTRADDKVECPAYGYKGGNKPQ